MDNSAWIAFGGLLFLVFCQTAAVAYWIGGLSARAKSNTYRIDKLEARDATTDGNDKDMIREVATLGQKVVALEDAVRRLSTLVDGANRQLSSLVTRRRGAAPPMSDTLSDE